MNQTRTYRGERIDGKAVVHIVQVGRETKDLPLYLGVRNHSPDGFEWSYEGSGPAQLALALCMDATHHDVTRVMAVYQSFKRRIVGRWKREGFEVTSAQVLTAIQEIESDKERR